MNIPRNPPIAASLRTIASPEWAKYFSYIWKKYKTSEEMWRKAYKKQKGLCAICGKKRDKLIPDHDHRTGKFRGLLCHWCNGLLGKVEKHGKRISQYLEE